eukprot:Blabericola_migrator_1__1377@NODE_1359_length_4725_cov_105_142121_g912_i0_p1_GENE_NODE_1359_length_4725_cov_105_142121_g912_i0NODE_1359_length_4725_cov_105_142121_g912_i0_p1_ORF_typecomplete_len382_score82_56SHNiTPR/PF10516_9/5_5e03SHNiTPR/PF10516_9/0_00025TPR_16/PF13432_6/21TPR_16/PF13432_6/3_8e03TPR_16/PF13432_6/0_96TPR_12/PF13424_6/14TPR_12/PF13424_6/0_94TPR_2/PF07719_17/3_5e02TPR_2/PF07719_17/4_6e03TPR_2/PF07719_17/0_11TPR_7/PF13176_6/1_5e02TPR_7/PF13176_6/1TPR_MalT/PF17874_1/81TPR_MalT/PF17
MARQKPSTGEVKRNKPVWQEPKTVATSLEDVNDQSPVFDTESETEQDPEDSRTPEEVLLDARNIRKTDLNEAINLFELSLKLKLAQLSGEGDAEETHPLLAPFWLAYGDALYEREETRRDLFTLQSDGDAKDEKQDDERETAWQCLDLARLCFEKLLKSSNHVLAPADESEKLWDMIARILEGQSLWIPVERSAEMAKLIDDAIFTRLRLGDCSQAETQFEKAIEDFEESLRLGIVYRVPTEKALEPAIPLCHCLLAVDSERTEQAFKFSILTLEVELKKPNLTSERIETLVSAKEDLEEQLKEYLQSHEDVKREAREAILALVSGLNQQAAETKLENKVDPEAVDLGVVGGRKRKKPDPSTTQPLQRQDTPNASNDIQPI